jgi:hypothetical protein
MGFRAYRGTVGMSDEWGVGGMLTIGAAFGAGVLLGVLIGAAL